MGKGKLKTSYKMAELFEKGKHFATYKFLGAHSCTFKGDEGIKFSVWVPEVKKVSLVGNFCGWDEGIEMRKADKTDIWTVFVAGLGSGEMYKYKIETENGDTFYKADPYAFYSEMRPKTASYTWNMGGYLWNDDRWMKKRKGKNVFEMPLNIYEVHAGSWKMHRNAEGKERFYTYKELADELIPYVLDMGYTHIELLPIMEHPLDDSWGYQITGFYSATSRYGTPQELKYFIDKCHQNGIGVILDWVPGHFCRDEQGLSRFNGKKLYEKEEHPNWGTYKFDYGKGAVRSFLISNALFWIKEYHADGLRVDGVSSMIYLNFGVNEEKNKRYNELGGEENREAVSFLKELSQVIVAQCPGVITIAEESSAWPMVTAPTEKGGLGFHYKWNMGWMNDTLEYFMHDFPSREQAHDLLTFSMMYAFSENFVLPLSHDEVVHGKRSLIGRMPGDYWRKFANMRLMCMYQMCHSGAKLSFMGNEIAQFIEWRFYEGIEWFLTEYESHGRYRDFVRAMNHVYLNQPSLWEKEHGWDGFSWVDANNSRQGIIIFQRMGKDERDSLTVILNMQTETYRNFRIGVDRKGRYEEIINSDDIVFGGSGKTNPKLRLAEPVPMHGKPFSISVTVPPVGGVIFKRRTKKRKTGKNNI